MRLRIKNRILIAVIVLVSAAWLLSGCAGWRSVRQPATVEPPEQYLNALSPAETSDGIWWDAFSDSTLNRLMEQMFTGNLTLQQAVARLDQSRAGVATSRAGFVPAITAQGNVIESGEVEESDTPSMTVEQPRYNGAVTASYEIDLWGKITAGYSAARATYFASQQDLRALTMTMSAQLARAYYQVIELRNQLALLDQTVASYEGSYQLVYSRYQRGVVTSQDVYQARTTLAGAQAQRTSVAAYLKVAEHSLAVLLGLYPQDGLVPAESDIPATVEPVSAGLPSDLLQRRPDVQAAYYRLVAADKSAAEAVAARLPSFSLTGSIEGSEDDLENLVDPENLIWNAIGSITLPLFQGGKLKANADRAEAAWREQLGAYQEVVLNAYQEVEDALVQTSLLKEYVAQLETQVAAAESALRLTNENYLRGISNYLAVVTAQTTYFNARLSLTSARRELVNAHIDLAVALGGGWTEDYIEHYVMKEN